MKTTKASGRYAQALFNISQEKNIEDTVLNNCRVLLNMFETELVFVDFVKNPTIAKSKKTDFFKKVFAGFHGVMLDFLILAVRKGRESELNNMAQKYIDLYNTQKGVVVVEIISAKPLASDLKMNLKQKMNVSGSVEIKETIDKNVIGGVIIKMGDSQYDASIRKKINNVKRAFQL